MEKEMRYAVLIDADNVAAKYTKYILDEVSNYGVVTYKRVYGDWTRPNLAGWKNMALDNAITPIQQYSYTTGKNATDSAMIIDAMDILYSRNVDGFCIVSSDSDFTRLAIRLRESGIHVIGMGEQKTPKPFSTACNAFKYLEVLADEELQSSAANDKVKLKTLESAIISIITENANLEAQILLDAEREYDARDVLDERTEDEGDRHTHENAHNHFEGFRRVQVVGHDEVRVASGNLQHGESEG